MAVTLLSWIMILFLAVSLGSVFLYGIMDNSAKERTSIEFDLAVVTGLMCLNVYAQIYSIFSNVGIEAFFLILAAGLLCSFFWLIDVKPKRKVQLDHIAYGGWRPAALFVMITFIGLCTLKAPNNVDTYLYHAQAIRWIEEYGVVPGLGNLHNRFAYNSAFMPLQALFSFAWLFEQPLHSLNGFFGCFLVCYAVITNKLFSRFDSRLSDFLKLVIIVYVYVNRNNLSSPGTDISAMLVLLYISCKWSEYTERKERDPQFFGVVCLIAVWTVTLKLSAVTCLLLAVYPAAVLIKEKKWKIIRRDIACGIVIAAPWLVRNVIISGYLLYPYSRIDLFGFDWKMPAEILDYDRKEIIVWGREVKDVSRYDESVGQWFGTWFGNQMLRNKIFIIAGFAATAVIAVLILMKLTRIIKKKESVTFFLEDVREGLLIAAMLAGEIFWLFSAPLVRYGMVYLLMPSAVIAFLVKEAAGEKRFRKWMFSGIIFAGCLAFLYKDEDFRAVEPHGYWKMDNVKNDWYGFEIYTPAEGYISGYADFPAAAREDTLEDILPRGSRIEDGFRPR